MFLSEKQRKLIESIAKINNIARVSIWLYDKDRESVSSDLIYSLKDNTFLLGLTLKKTDFPNYFKALELDREIIADDALTNPCTSEFSEAYLKPLGITSMLDVPIRVYDKIIGVVCHEHIGKKRVWSETEKLFAFTTADILGLTIETEDKEKVYNSLKESEQRYGLTSTALPVIFWTTDKNLIITSSRGKGLMDLGLESDAIVGKTISEFLNTDPNDAAYAHHMGALAGKSANYEYQLNNLIFQIYLEPLKDIHNEITGCIGLAINITERKESDITIQERELQLRTLFDAVADVIFVIDINKDGSYEFSSVNQAFINSTGFTPTQIIGKKVRDIVPLESLQLVLDRYELAIKERKVVSWEETNTYPKGTLTGIVSIAPLYDQDGNCTQLIGSVKDITDRKKIELELKSSKEQLSIVFNTVADVIFVLDVLDDGGYSFNSVNKAFGITTGIDTVSIVGKKVEEVIPQESLTVLLNYYESAIKERKTIIWEETNDYPSGKITGIVGLTPVFNSTGKCTKLIGSVKNITERKKFETELQKNEERFRSLAEKTNIIPWTTDAGMSRLDYVGPQAEAVLGYPVEKWYEKDFWPNHIHPDDRFRTVKEAVTNQIGDTNYDHEYRMVGADGRVIWFRDVVSIEKVSNGKHMLRGYLIDITERKKFEIELQENEERFRLLAESTDIIPWETDAKTFQFTYVGPQAERILEYPVEEWYTNDFWPDHIHPDDKEDTLAFCLKAFKEKKNYEFEYRMVAKDGSIVWLHDVVTVQLVNNVPVTLRGFLINITERKIADEKIQKLNTELEERVQERTAQLMEINRELEKAKTSAEESKTAKELFLANMSHEIRTPLNAIIGFQQLLKESTLDEEQQEFVESIDFASRNLLVIINDILDLSKIEAGKFQFDEGESDIGDTIKSVIELVDLRAKEKKLKLVISQDPAIPNALYFDATRLSQILLNLVGNAIKFTEMGEVSISTHLLEENEDTVLCEFIVKDTGIGISQDMISSIFERFTQESIETTRKYGGTGLGLTISRYLVEMQGGTIHARSKKGEGSEFLFQLRLKKVRHKKTISEYKQTEVNGVAEPTKKLNILLAEDVLLNQRLVVKIMEKWHHNLDIAENGKIAVEKVKNNYYDLILMDIQMPEMDGYQATTIIRSIPDERIHSIPIVALTAHASSSEAEKCINLGMNSYISKPFSQQKLLQVINELIAK
ncbi:MAG: PAS domain S-box protein [Bacteroidota bacterium]|nr:PAS domain S-box protein [Bacteroidota bacterium]